MMIKSVFSIFLFCSIMYAQETPWDYLTKIQEKYNQIEDYSVMIHINVDMPGFRMPDKTIRFYYKAPDKTRIEAKGFAVVPREGLFLKPDRFLEKGTELIFEREEYINDKSYIVIKVIPPVKKGPRPDIFLYIDKEMLVISKMITDFGNENKLLITAIYQRIGDFWMPETTKMELSYRGKFKDLMAKPGTHNLEALKDTSELNHGTILVTFKDYRINQGLNEAIFENELSKEED